MPSKPTHKELEKRIKALEKINAGLARRPEMPSVENSRYRAFFKSANDAIFMDENYRFIECNNMALEMFGCAHKREIIDFHPWDFSPAYQPDGRTVHLRHLDFQPRVTRRWTSPATGATYPLAWEVRLPERGLELQLKATLDDQEMITTGSTGVTYREGSVSVNGRAGGVPVTGQGYMELTGCAEPEAPHL